MSMPVHIAFLTKGLKEDFDSLQEGKFQDKQLYSYICRAQDDLKKNPSSGTKLPKRLWPKEYVQKWEITNLWKYDLPNSWRLVYTIEADDVKILAIILEWFNHKEYERRFGY